jgi:hypothetical protein
MALIKKQRGRVTYYTREGNRWFSDLVVEEQENGDLKIHFVGMTGGSTVGHQDPEKEIPILFDIWEGYLKEAGICQSLSEVDFLEVHAFGAAPKAPSPISDPEGYVAERRRIREAYAKAYASYWEEKMPDNGLPVRFTVYLEDLPDSKASYELGATALYQKSLKKERS